MNIIQNLQNIKENIPSNVRLIAVSKYIDSQAIRLAYSLGLRDFAESRIQEAERKKQELCDLTDIQWHLTGHLQSNKIRKAIKIFDWIHSIDDSLLLLKINSLLDEELVLRSIEIKKLKVLLQIKLSEDLNKQGLKVNNKFFEELKKMSSLNNIEIKGLMTILPQNTDTQESLNLFSQLFELKQKINALNIPNIQLEELSMGMSDDYLLAIKAGATMIRLGKAIFSN